MSTVLPSEAAPAPLAYAVITPARDEAANLPRLAEALAAQRVRPRRWVIVDNGSTDGTRELARELEAAQDWITVLSIPGEVDPVRGRPIVRALTAGFAALRPLPDVVVNVDADISFGPGYFEGLLAAFADDPQLGIASGEGHELQDGRWTQRHLTGSTVWGASRAWRRACLEAVLPLEERLGWDGIDQYKANARGWRTGIVAGLPFHHHRREGERDGAWRARAEQGRVAYYVGYRAWYLAARALFQATQHPSGLGLLWGYAGAAVRRAERLSDASAVAYVRREQSVRLLTSRAREALGVTSPRC